MADSSSCTSMGLGWHATDRPLSEIYGSVASGISTRSDLLTASAPVVHQDRAQSGSLVGFGPRQPLASVISVALLNREGRPQPSHPTRTTTTNTPPSPSTSSLTIRHPSPLFLLISLVAPSVLPLSLRSRLSTFTRLHKPEPLWILGPGFLFLYTADDYFGPMF
jgi:hypothetical protein